MSSRQRESNRIKCDARERRRRHTPTTRSAGYIYTQYAITQRDATVVPRRPSSTNAAPPRAAAATNTTPSTRTTTYDPQNPYTQPTHTPITRIKKPTTDNRTFGKPILNTITLYEIDKTPPNARVPTRGRPSIYPSVALVVVVVVDRRHGA